MGVFKNGVGRPSNETIKKRNIFKGICVLFGLIIIVLVGYILNDKGIINISGKDDKKTVDKKTDKDTNKENKKEEILDVNSDVVVNLFNKMNNFTNDLDLLDAKAKDNLYSYFYQNDSLKQEQVDDRIKFAYSFANLYKDIKINREWYDAEKFRKDFIGSVSDVNNESIKIFGSGFDINKVMINGVGPAIFGEKTMINGDKITISCAEIGGAQGANIYTKIISAKKANGNLLIENKVMFVYCSLYVNGYQGIFKTAKKYIDNCTDASCYGLTDKISELPNDNKIKIDDYLDKLDTYRWTFKENTDGSYTFESVEKVK